MLSVREQHVRELAKLRAATFDPPARAVGDGYVTCGGGKYWHGVVVAVKLLREVSDLPVQIWHRGNEEPVDMADLAGVRGVTLHSALDYPHRMLRGWEVKTVALLHCGLRRAIFVDGDAYCVADPSPLLELASRYPLVAWLDFPDANQVKWEAFGLNPARGNKIQTFQGGQFAIDLIAARRELVIADWLNRHSDYSYHFGYGDQDMWRVALALTGGKCHVVGKSEWRKIAFECKLGGKTLIVHRTHSKLGIGDDKSFAELPKELRAFELLDELRGGAKAVFGAIYRGAGDWGTPGSSGPGSSGEVADWSVEILNREIAGRSVVDLGSGDGRIARRLVASSVVSVEVHEPHVKHLTIEAPEIEWVCLDIDRDREKLPSGDVAVLRDVLLHWPSATILSWLAWGRSSGRWKTILLCQDCVQAKDDCRLGDWRGLDPAKPPLSLVPGLVVVASAHGKSVLRIEC